MNQPAGVSFAVIVNLRAQRGVVNSQFLVQLEKIPNRKRVDE
jgi:hypothetical protein